MRAHAGERVQRQSLAAGTASIATAATAVIAAQTRVESLRLEHASEGIDGHLVGERMLVRLAAAQAAIA